MTPNVPGDGRVRNRVLSGSGTPGRLRGSLRVVVASPRHLDFTRVILETLCSRGWEYINLVAGKGR